MQTSPLTKAVQHLYGTGAIKKDKDIADKTGYNKATVSSYISGKITPSADFIKAKIKKGKQCLRHCPPFKVCEQTGIVAQTHYRSNGNEYTKKNS